MSLREREEVQEVSRENWVGRMSVLLIGAAGFIGSHVAARVRQPTARCGIDLSVMGTLATVLIPTR